MSSTWTEWRFCQTRNSPSLLPNPVSLCEAFTSAPPASSYLLSSFGDWSTHVYGIPTTHSPVSFSPYRTLISFPSFSKFLFLYFYTLSLHLHFIPCADSILSSATIIIICMLFKYITLVWFWNVIVHLLQNPTGGAAKYLPYSATGVSVRIQKAVPSS